MTTPFRTACPDSAIKPIAADTERGISRTNSATKPPMSASGTLTRIRVAALRGRADEASKKLMRELTMRLADRRLDAGLKLLAGGRKLERKGLVKLVIEL